MINWNKTNNEILTLMWNEGKNDIEIAAYFNAGIYAIAKQRSNIGLITRKRMKGLHRKVKTLIPIVNKMFFVAHYQQDGVNHFSRLDTENSTIAKEMIRKLIYNKGVTSVTLLQPTTQLVLQTITESEF